MRIFPKMIFWLLLKLEISYRIMISWRMVSFRGVLWRLHFCMVKYLNFHNSTFALKIHFNVLNGKATVWHTPLVLELAWMPHTELIFGNRFGSSLLRHFFRLFQRWDRHHPSPASTFGTVGFTWNLQTIMYSGWKVEMWLNGQGKLVTLWNRFLL